MILSGLTIKEMQKTGLITIDPFNEKQLNPNSYNLKLHSDMLVYDFDYTCILEGISKPDPLDPKTENKTKKLIIPKEGLVLQPGTLYLAKTIEHTETPNLVPVLEGRSSIGRLGLFVHVTAGFGDVGYKGQWTLELTCIHPVKVYTGLELCQISYHTIDGPFEAYKGRYQNSDQALPCGLYKDHQNL